MADSIGRFVLKNDNEFMQAYEELLRDPTNNLYQQRLENRLNQLANYLRDYWKALSRIFRDAFTGPLRHREEYSVQRSTGVYVFHRIFSGIYPPNTLPRGMTPIGVRHHCQRRGFSLTVMEDVLRHMVQNATRASEFGRAVDDEFWHKGKRGVRPRGDTLARATNQRDIGQLSARLGKHLPPLP